MEILQLKYFISVAELGSITAAARRYGIPQPSMSQMISKLENELGVKLFDRENNHLQINESGRIFYKYVHNAISRLSDGVQHVRDNTDNAAGHIQLIVNYNRDVVVNCMMEAMSESEELTFRVYHHVNGDGGMNPFDLCVTSSELSINSLSNIELDRSRLAVAVYPGHAFYEKAEIALAELGGEDIAMMRPNGDMGSAMLGMLARGGVSPRIRLTCNEPHYLKRFVQARRGLVVVASCYVYDDYFANGIRVIPISDADSAVITRLYWHNDRYMSPAVLSFRDRIIRKFMALNGAD